MADPGTVLSVAVRPGHNPGDVIVSWAALVADPVVTHYTVYLDDNTGVDSSSQFRKRKLKTTAIKQTFRGLTPWRDVFATVTATNSEGTSASDATEASGRARTRI